MFYIYGGKKGLSEFSVFDIKSMLEYCHGLDCRVSWAFPCINKKGK